MGLMLLATLLFAVSTAHAVFPGQNGKIGFGSDVDQLYTIYPNGADLARVTSGQDVGPTWSPDGTKFLFVKFTATASQLWVANQDGSAAAMLTTTGSNESWSPDGTKIAFQRGNDVWTVNPGGGGLTNLTADASSGAPDWSPDGTKIAFVRNTPPDGQIWVMNSDGTGKTMLTSGVDSSPKWSPDGTKIAFVRKPSGLNHEIWSMNPDGSNQTNLTNTPTTIESLDEWSPDSTQMLYVVPAAPSQIWKMNANGTGQIMLAFGRFGPSFSPDGTRIAYAVCTQAPTPDCDVRVMDQDGSNNRLLVEEPVGQTGVDWQPCSTPCPPPPAAYDVPSSAYELRVPLVPNFRQTISTSQCQARGGMVSSHGAPLAFTSCNPPGYVPGTVAHLGPTSTANANSTALIVIHGDRIGSNGDQADVAIQSSVRDVRNSAGLDYDPNPSGPEATLVVKLRISDRHNGSSQTDPGTVADLDFAVPVPCAATPATNTGSVCAVSTTADAVTSGMILEDRDTALQAFRVRLNDSGANGTRGDADDRTFATQGIYIP